MSVIEKHLTIDRNDGAVDSKFSLEPKEFSMLSKETKKMFYALGKTKYGPSDHNEKLSKITKINSRMLRYKKR